MKHQSLKKIIMLGLTVALVAANPIVSMAYIDSTQEQEMLDYLATKKEMDYKYDPNAVSNEYVGDMIEYIKLLPSRDVVEPIEISTAAGYDCISMSTSYGVDDYYGIYQVGIPATYVKVGTEAISSRISNLIGFSPLSGPGNDLYSERNFFYYIIDPETGEELDTFKEGENRLVVQLNYDYKTYSYSGQRVIWCTLIGVDATDDAILELNKQALSY